MFGIHDLTIFILSGLLLNLTPGADTLLIVSQSVGRGWRAGAVAALGVGAGCCLHVLAATLGLSALLSTSAAAFLVVKLVGAAYLVYMGWSLLRSTSKACAQEAAPAVTSSAPHGTWRRVFAQGFLTNALNPKVALFFLAFLPQFIDSASSSERSFAFLVLGLIFTVNGTVWCLCLAGLSAQARSVSIPPVVTQTIRRFTGILFVGLGLKLAFAKAQ